MLKSGLLDFQPYDFRITDKHIVFFGQTGQNKTSYSIFVKTYDWLEEKVNELGKGFRISVFVGGIDISPATDDYDSSLTVWADTIKITDWGEGEPNHDNGNRGGGNRGGNNNSGGGRGGSRGNRGNGNRGGNNNSSGSRSSRGGSSGSRNNSNSNRGGGRGGNNNNDDNDYYDFD